MMETNELTKTLTLHKSWLLHQPDGVRADLVVTLAEFAKLEAQGFEAI